MSTSFFPWRCPGLYLVPFLGGMLFLSNAHCAKVPMQSSLQEKRQLEGRVRSPAYRRIPRQQSLDFIDYPRRGVSVRESPGLLISRKQHPMLGGTIKYPWPGAISCIVYD